MPVTTHSIGFTSRFIRVLALVLFTGMAGGPLLASASAQPPEKGPPPGKGPGPDQRSDMELFHYLLDHRREITRNVSKLPDGVETLTESSKPEVARKIKEHVKSMHARVKEGRGIHLRDPLFAAIFKDYRKITMAVEETERGVKVRETSEDAYTVKLIQAHAEVVNQFVANGRPEMRKDHPVPQKEGK